MIMGSLCPTLLLQTTGKDGDWTVMGGYGGRGERNVGGGANDSPERGREHGQLGVRRGWV